MTSRPVLQEMLKKIFFREKENDIGQKFRSTKNKKEGSQRRNK